MYRYLPQPAAASTLVVRAQLDGVAARPVLSGGARYSVILHLRVSQTIVGTVPASGVVNVQIMVPSVTTRAQALQKVAELKRDLSPQEVVAFLSAPRKGVYFPITDLGLWAKASRARLDAPLAALPPAGRWDFTDISGVETLDQLAGAIDHLRDFKTFKSP